MGTSPYIGEIMLVGFNFAPRGWAFCDGQLLPISQNTALFSLLGTTYGGDGRSTFALPDLRGRAPIHRGRGPGLRDYRQGSKGGSETVTLNQNQIPSHSHGLLASTGPGNSPTAAGNTLAAYGTSLPPDGPYSNTAPSASLNAKSISATGGNQAHTNMQPYLAVNYVICLQGTFPSRS